MHARVSSERSQNLLLQFHDETLSSLRRVSQKRVIDSFISVHDDLKFKSRCRSCGECANGNADNCLKEGCVVGDGIGRGYLSINFNLPGPKIEVCKDDVIVVDVYNEAEGLSTTLHWHGIRQFGTPFMDGERRRSIDQLVTYSSSLFSGVPYLTQCPIPFGESFRYSFYATDEGTHFYHSHAGHQKPDGVYGPLIVRGLDKENPNRKTYDFDLPEHTIMMADWMHGNADAYMPGLIKRSVLSQSILINGHGRFYNVRL